MTKQERLISIQKNVFKAKKHFYTYKEIIIFAEILIKTGFNKNKLNNYYIQNGLKLLKAFITNKYVRNIINSIEEGLKEEKNKQNKKQIKKGV